MSRKALLGAGAVAAIVSSGVLIGTAGATSASTRHTLTLTASRLSHTNTSKSTFVEANTLYKSGKKVGYETQSCNDGGTNVVCAVTFSLAHGVLLGHLTEPITTHNTSSAAGRITGGLATYTGDKGTLHASFKGRHSKYVLTYHS